MSVVRTALFALALLAGALSAGFLYTFSILVMPALATADAATAIVAMQKINLSVRTRSLPLPSSARLRWRCWQRPQPGWPAIAGRPGSRF